MPDTDIAAAARRSAYRLKEGAWPHLDDLLALLPVLDVVGAEAGEDRVERWARAICKASGDRELAWEAYTREARAAIALAEAERAVALSRRDTSAVV